MYKNHAFVAISQSTLNSPVYVDWWQVHFLDSDLFHEHGYYGDFPIRRISDFTKPFSDSEDPADNLRNLC